MRLIGRFAVFWLLGSAACPIAAATQIATVAVMAIQIRKDRAVLCGGDRHFRPVVGVVVHPADIQDRDGAGIVIQAIHDLFPWLRHLFADSVYNGPNLREALAKFRDWTIEIVTRAAGVTGFQLLPRRWVVAAVPQMSAG
jgi:hypothetical protein